MRWYCLLIALLLAGCAGAPKSSPAAGKDPPTTAPAGDALTLNWTTLKVEDLKPLLRIEKAGQTAQFGFKVKTGRGDGQLYFGELVNGDEQLLPLIGTRAGEQYKVVKVSGDWSFDQWRSVLSGPHSGEIWGILDQANDAENADNQADNITLAHSTDGGKTFHLAALHKPCIKAVFYDLVMARNGHGRITLALMEDCGKIKSGLYHYHTTDGGKTFHRPEYEPDATTPADDVPDEEQPGQGTMSASAR